MESGESSTGTLEDEVKNLKESERGWVARIQALEEGSAEGRKRMVCLFSHRLERRKKARKSKGSDGLEKNEASFEVSASSKTRLQPT